MAVPRFLRRLHRRIDKLSDPPWLTDALARLAIGQIERRYRAARWETDGDAALGAALATDGPVILATWHGRLAMSPWSWRAEWGPVTSLTSAARPGRIVAQVHRHFGIGSLPMKDRKSNRATSVQAARLVRQGHSLAFACDGPLGPALHMQRVTLDWARLTGAPIWLWSYAVDRQVRLPSWDRMILPRAGARGVMLWRPWTEAVPKRTAEAEIEVLRLRLERDLNALTAEAERRVGRSG